MKESESLEIDELDSEDIHCMPNDGKHACSKDCWCEPELAEDYRDDGGNRLYVHRDLQ